MSRYFHIVLGDSVQGSLKWFFKEHKKNDYFGEIKNFREDLSTGSIYKLENNVGKRIEWFKHMYNATGSLDDIDDIEKEIMKTYNYELDISKDVNIIIWHGNNVIEQTALRYLVNRFKSNKIYEVNVSKYIQKQFEDNKYYVRSTGECSPEELGVALDKISLIEDKRKGELISQWNQLRETRFTLRIVKDDKIISVDEDYYDNEILKYTSNEFVKAPRIIGMVMGMSYQIVGDAFIDYRLRKLIKVGKIVYRGKLKSMREFDIKLNI